MYLMLYAKVMPALITPTANNARASGVPATSAERNTESLLQKPLKMGTPDRLSVANAMSQ